MSSVKMRDLTLFHQYTLKPLKEWPLLSVIVPACNEEESIGQAVKTLLQQEYANLEIVLINDRSSDKTGEIIESLAKKYPRVRPLHIKELPEGWLGKVHALHRGTEEAKGEWLLFTDADIHFSENSLRKSVNLAVEKGYDHLALIPGMITSSFLLEIVIVSFGIFFTALTRAADIGKKDSSSYIGVGAFNLVKKSAYDKSEGFEYIKLEIADDVGLGLVMKRSGARTGLAVAMEDVTVTWYSTVKEMFCGLEKNSFGVSSHYSYYRLALNSILVTSFAIAPFMAMLLPKSPFILFTGLTAYITLILFGIFSRKRFGFRLLPYFFIPAGFIILGLMMINSGYKCLKQGGIYWRGAFYSIKELRENQRVNF